MYIARSTGPSATSATSADPAPVPGKQPAVAPPANANAAPGPASGALPAAVAAHAGETFLDGGHYTWRIEAAGAFVCVAQPASAEKSSVGARVIATKSPELWQALCGLALDTFAPPTAPASDGAAPARDGAPAIGPAEDDSAFSLDGFLAMLGLSPLAEIGRLVTDLVEAVYPNGAGEPTAPATPEAPATSPAPESPASGGPASVPALGPGPAPTPDPTAPEAGGGETAPAVVGDVRRCSSGDARLRDATGNELAPRKVVPLGAYVRVVECTTASKPLARVQLLASIDATNGSELGWTNESNLAALVRAPRPSNPSGQMAALLAAAKSRVGGSAQGLCYRFVKGHILAAGGYGDILDIYQDERFEGFQGSAVDFAAAVQKHGAAALGLEEVGGLPASAPPGTLLVTRGNGKIRLSEEHGDIAVIGGVEGGCVVCYNDFTMKLVADPQAWTSGDYVGVLVGMYRPIVRK